MTYAEMLLEKRAGVWDKAKALLDTAADEKRELTAEETASYEAMTADLTDLRARVDAFEKSSADNAAIEASLRSLAAKPKEIEDTAPTAEGTALRSFLAGETRSVDLKGTPAELRTLAKGTTTAGGNTVPTSFYGKLWAHLILTANVLNAGATVWHTDSGENIQVPTTTAHSQAALVAEAGVIPASDPAFGQRFVGAYKYGVLLQVARELLTDTAVDLEGYLAMQAGRAVGNAYGADLVNGNGSGKPTGILTNATPGVTGSTGSGGSPTFDNLIDLYYSVIAPYRNMPEAAFLFNDMTAGVLRKLKDTTGRYLWEPTLTPGTPDTILGKPIYTDPNMPTVGLGAKSILFGDMSSYLARVVNGIRFERSDDFAFNTDLVTYRCLIRGDGILIDQTGAVKTFTGAAS